MLAFNHHSIKSVRADLKAYVLKCSELCSI